MSALYLVRKSLTEVLFKDDAAWFGYLIGHYRTRRFNSLEWARDMDKSRVLRIHYVASARLAHREMMKAAKALRKVQATKVRDDVRSISQVAAAPATGGELALVPAQPSDRTASEQPASQLPA